jgi:hypothetical protein
MVDQAQPSTTFQLGTQAFLVLCQLFDGCYDELKKHPQLDQTVETIAQELLGGVSYVKEQSAPPKQVTLSMALPQLYFLRKLLTDMLHVLPAESAQEKTRKWLLECLQTLDRAATQEDLS